MNTFIITIMYCKHRLQIHDSHSVFTVRTRHANGALEDPTALPCAATKQRSPVAVHKGPIRSTQNTVILYGDLKVYIQKIHFSTNTRHTCQKKSKDTIFARLIRLRILFIFCLYD